MGVIITAIVLLSATIAFIVGLFIREYVFYLKSKNGGRLPKCGRKRDLDWDRK